MVTFTPSQSVWQFYVPSYHKRAINVPSCKWCVNYSTLPAKGHTNFSEVFFNFWIFQLCSTFSNFKNICAILENLSGETKNSNFDICKILLQKNLVNLKHLRLLSMEHMGLSKRLFGQGQRELNIYFSIYLTLYAMCKQAF